MNWDAVGAIAELAGAAGVIATLAYLAVQIRQSTAQVRQNTRASRGAAYQDVIGYLQSILAPAAFDADTSEIIRRGLQDVRGLSEAEHFRFHWIMGGLLTSYDNAFYQYQDGVVSNERWEVLVSQLRWFLAAPGFREWWQSYPSESLSTGFVEVVTSEIRRLHSAL